MKLKQLFRICNKQIKHFLFIITGPNLVARQEYGPISSILSGISSTPTAPGATETPDATPDVTGTPDAAETPDPETPDAAETPDASGTSDYLPVPPASPPVGVNTIATASYPTPSASASPSAASAYSHYSSLPTAPTASSIPPYSPPTYGSGTTAGKKSVETPSAANKVENSLFGIIIAGVFSLLL
ncbi:hypothetical protein C1645_517806 [Glomus cerebriforme]|uniref:Uncharacterized protein n=1 Tax=Glomus cerebriforme TaxID=658196 RepID=A0A397TM58_9GLOM|nr:hypothetical protein C1645_508247 [Glomus cerebriforme]RIA99058.1 hypothetical protein C1645_517806 [Glomus cerebriforme]